MVGLRRKSRVFVNKIHGNSYTVSLKGKDYEIEKIRNDIEGLRNIISEIDIAIMSYKNKIEFKKKEQFSYRLHEAEELLKNKKWNKKNKKIMSSALGFLAKGIPHSKIIEIFGIPTSTYFKYLNQLGLKRYK